MPDDRVMLLIDADNVSPDVMEQAVRLLLNQHGGLHVRRAYCTAESAVANQSMFKRLSIKPMVNLAAGKNSTDIAMAVDAIDLVLSERPDVVVIASSDSDFAPLVQRLREKGCVVRGIGQKGKVADETQDVYDDYTVLEHHRSASADKPARKTAARKTAARKAPAGKTAASPRAVAADAGASAAPAAPAAKTAARKTAAAKKVAAKSPAAKAPRKTTARKAAAVPQASRSDAGDGSDSGHSGDGGDSGDSGNTSNATNASNASNTSNTSNGSNTREPRATRETAAAAARPRSAAPLPATGMPRGGASVQDVLACLPELAAGQSLALNVAVQRLREAQLLGKNSSSLKLFAQLADRFDLLPPAKPNQVRLRR